MTAEKSSDREERELDQYSAEGERTEMSEEKRGILPIVVSAEALQYTLLSLWEQEDIKAIVRIFPDMTLRQLWLVVNDQAKLLDTEHGIQVVVISKVD